MGDRSDQEPELRILQTAGNAGRFDGQPSSVSSAWTRRKTQTTGRAAPGSRGRWRQRPGSSIRAGYGRYYDVGYTNANILFAAINATGIGAGTVFTVTNAAGIRKADGTFFRVGDAISTIQSQNEAGGALPLNSHIASPRIRQPYSDQYSLGWSHQLDAATVIDIDYMH